MFSTNIWADTTYSEYLKAKEKAKLSNKFFSTYSFGDSFPQERFYIGLGYGKFLQTSNTTYSAEFQNNHLPTLVDLDQGINIFFGYNIFSFMSLEVEYNILKNKSSNYGYYFDIDRNTNVNTTNTFPSSNNIWFMNLVFKYPYLYKHVPFIKLGMGYSQFTTSEQKLFEGVWVDEEEKYSYTKESVLFKAGIGYEYILTKNHSIQLEYNYFISPISDLKQTQYDLYESNLDETIIMKEAVKLSYSKINIAYKFSF